MLHPWIPEKEIKIFSARNMRDPRKIIKQGLTKE
jgi:hypothetical protein